MMHPRIAAALAVGMLVGCGSDGPRLTRVDGILTQNGQPVEGVEIAFLPDQGNAEVTSGTATTDSKGYYRAYYRADRSGLAPGKYKVVVSKLEPKPGMEIPSTFQDQPLMALEMGFVRETMPAAYADPMKSPLDVEVPAKGGTFDLDITGEGQK